MAWTSIAATYLIKNARIVVMVQNGGAVVETRHVEYIEGRHASPYNAELREELPCLDLLSGFTEVPGRIVIDGMTENGRMEIRGNGDFGYDEAGRVVGEFDAMPMILLDEYTPPPSEQRHMPIEEWMEYMQSIEPQSPEQFDRATRGRRFELDDEGNELRE